MVRKETKMKKNIRIVIIAIIVIAAVGAVVAYLSTTGVPMEEYEKTLKRKYNAAIMAGEHLLTGSTWIRYTSSEGNDVDLCVAGSYVTNKTAFDATEYSKDRYKNDKDYPLYLLAKDVSERPSDQQNIVSWGYWKLSGNWKARGAADFPASPPTFTGV